MEIADLATFISCLEYGTKIHISVVFLNDFGNFKTVLPFERVVHSKPYCTYVKSKHNGYKRCFACRNLAIARAIREAKGFGGLCINKLYEYVHPVVINGETVAVVFIGNIYARPTDGFDDTLEMNFDESMCERFAYLIDSHIKLLDREYSKIKKGFDPLITNVMNYIEDSLGGDISVSHIAGVFGYSKKYVGQLFKSGVGMSIKEYVNFKRLERAQVLLLTTDTSVTDVSLSIGYNNVTYFNRCFKAQFGVSPSEYRKKTAEYDACS